MPLIFNGHQHNNLPPALAQQLVNMNAVALPLPMQPLQYNHLPAALAQQLENLPAIPAPIRHGRPSAPIILAIPAPSAPPIQLPQYSHLPAALA